ncbi:hypothetical protein MC885_013762 [Smutsia gigantea]|nr:hypothetical protein MC885_013762 [Smutsia gigantea]
MRQDKLTGSLRRGGRCPKRQGGGGSGGVGTILSNVLKKRSCISRTAPRLLCTLEPGEDPELRLGHCKVARRPRSLVSLTRLDSARCRVPRLGIGRAGLAWEGRADEGPSGGSGLPRRGGPAARAGCPRAPTPQPVRGLALLVPGAAGKPRARPSPRGGEVLADAGLSEATQPIALRSLKKPDLERSVRNRERHRFDACGWGEGSTSEGKIGFLQLECQGQLAWTF